MHKEKDILNTLTVIFIVVTLLTTFLMEMGCFNGKMKTNILGNLKMVNLMAKVLFSLRTEIPIMVII